MIELNNNLKISIVIVLLSSYILYDKKPRIMFNDDGSFKQFGLKSNETIYHFVIIITIIGLTTYYGLLLKEGKYV
tara:strand:+ start:1328 stop:1552 length:225 start_codon:yes stop_codon:yes gene_type:complete